ncbi:hypothetical protein IAQ61_002479 [Plenodomus lingam]|uniref:uncharacterized protein n=1 Tax=Leptosphaeria maculans TaxID=5022 RepID=UPI003321F7D0|nr:hypothetical protein IAQ61_002479 [Plenodomus lingam]
MNEPNPSGSQGPTPSNQLYERSSTTSPDLPPGALPIAGPLDSTLLQELLEDIEGEPSDISKMFWMGPGCPQSHIDEAEEKMEQIYKECADMEAEMEKEKAEREERMRLQMEAQNARWVQEDSRANTDKVLESLMPVLSEDTSAKDEPVCDLQSVMALYAVYLELSREDGGYLGFEGFCIMFDIIWY